MNAASRRELEGDDRPLLILDVDETLVFGADADLDRPCDFYIGIYHIYKRPHLAEFLATVSDWFDLAIWSSGGADYVTAIAERICPPGSCWKFIWGRERCTPRTYFNCKFVEYVKDLKKVKRLGYNLNQILFVDDTESKLCRNFGNAIYVRPFFGDADDSELLPLCRYLASIREVENYRAIEKRYWHDHRI
jgi:TFIIF-interacting CTD phosphatase-like protein